MHNLTATNIQTLYECYKIHDNYRRRTVSVAVFVAPP